MLKNRLRVMNWLEIHTKLTKACNSSIVRLLVTHAVGATSRVDHSSSPNRTIGVVAATATNGAAAQRLGNYASHALLAFAPEKKAKINLLGVRRALRFRRLSINGDKKGGGSDRRGGAHRETLPRNFASKESWARKDQQRVPVTQDTLRSH